MPIGPSNGRACCVVCIYTIFSSQLGKAHKTSSIRRLWSNIRARHISWLTSSHRKRINLYSLLCIYLSIRASFDWKRKTIRRNGFLVLPSGFLLPLASLLYIILRIYKSTATIYTPSHVLPVVKSGGVGSEILEQQTISINESILRMASNPSGPGRRRNSCRRGQSSSQSLISYVFMYEIGIEKTLEENKNTQHPSQFAGPSISTSGSTNKTSQLDWSLFHSSFSLPPLLLPAWWHNPPTRPRKRNQPQKASAGARDEESNNKVRSCEGAGP